jgi:hypothetical protein
LVPASLNLWPAPNRDRTINRQSETGVATLAPSKVPYRLIYAGLGLVVIAAVALAIAFGGGGESTELPEVVEALVPGPGDAALAQAIVEVDLQPGFAAQIFIDGFPVPASEVAFVEATGLHRWQPTRGSLIFDRWSPGEHEVRIVWDRIAGLPQPGEFTWTFRVQ